MAALNRLAARAPENQTIPRIAVKTTAAATNSSAILSQCASQNQIPAAPNNATCPIRAVGVWRIQLLFTYWHLKLNSRSQRARVHPMNALGPRSALSHDLPLPPDDGEPHLRSALRELDLSELGVDLAPGRLDRFDLPAVGEGVVQLLARHAPRPLCPRFLVAETRQEHPPARLEDMRQP